VRSGFSLAGLESAPQWLATAGNVFSFGVAGGRLQHIWRPNGAISGVERRKTGFIVWELRLRLCPKCLGRY
jgi:hypothetical protein